MARILDFVSARKAAMRLTGLSQQNSAALEAIVELLDEDGRVQVSAVFDKLYPYEDKTANRNRNLNRLIKAVNKAAEGHDVALSMCITASKRGGAASRWVWFEGPDLEAPQFDTDTLRAIPEGQLAEQRAIDSGASTAVLLTFNPNETRAVWREFTGSEEEPAREVRGGQSYYHLADVNGVRVVHAISAQTTGEAQQSAGKALENWNPAEIYAVGIAFGVNPDKQSIGDVLISTAVLNYMHVRVEPSGDKTQRGLPRPASEALLARVRELEHARLGRLDWPTIHQGVLLSGDALVDNREYRDALTANRAGAVGGEMEGSGVERACRGIADWLVVKGICDWGAGKNNRHKERDQKVAARQAAKVVHAIIAQGSGDLPQGHRPLPSPSVATMGKFDEVFEHGSIIEDPRAATLSLDKQDPAPNVEAGRPVLEALLEWVSDSESEQFFALLGEYGMGKTVTSQRLAAELERRRETDPTLPMPLYFDLKRIGRAEEASSLKSTVEACMRDGWLPKESKDYTWDRFVRWLSSAPCLVIFDGLDELLVKFNESVGAGFTQQLLGVIDVVPQELRSQTKVMLSCRTQYFPTLRAQRNHFLLRDRGDVAADTYRAMTLLPLTEEQVRNYLEAAVPSIPVDAVMQTVRDIHNLTELSERPYTLKLISQYIPELERKRAAGEGASGATLYGMMTEAWLDRDDQKHYIAREHKPRLVAALAAHLWRSGITLLPVSDLHDWFHEWVSGDAGLLRRYANADIERLEEDLRTATFLSREDSSNPGFRFAHTSLLEYFLARHLAESAKRNEPEGWAIRVPSRETLSFLGELFQDEYSDALTNVSRWRTAYRPKASELLFAYALHARRYGLPVPVLRGINLDGAHLDDLVVQGSEGALVDLSGASFVGASLRRAVVEHVNLNRTDFTDTRFTQATFGSIRHKGALWPVGSSSAAWVAPKISGRNLLMQGEILSPLVDCQRVAVSADGSRVVTGSGDGTARVWDADTGDVVSVLDGHSDAVWSLAVSADGSRVVTGSRDRTARVWDADTGEVVSVLDGHSDAVWSLAVSADGSRVVTGSRDRTACVWDADSGEVVSVLDGHSDAVWSVAVSADGSRVVTGSGDGTARVWDADTGDVLNVFPGHVGSVLSVAVSADGSRVVTGSGDGTARVWDADTGDVVSVLEDHIDRVESVAVSADGSRVVTGSRDRTARVWDADSGEVVSVFEDHRDSVLSVAVSADGSRVVTGSLDGTARVWDADSGDVVSVLDGHSDAVWSVAVSADGSRVVTGSRDRTARVWDADSGEVVSVLDGHSDAVWSVAVSADGSRVVTGSLDGTARVWDADSGEVVSVLDGHSDAVWSVAVSADGSRVVTGSLDGTARVWDADSGEVVSVLDGHSDAVWSVAVSADGSRVVTGSRDGTARVWDADSGDVVSVLDGHSDAVWSVAVSADGSRVVTGSLDGTACVWDADSGEVVSVFEDHRDSVLSVAVSADGSRVVTGSLDGTARVWDADSGDVVSVLDGHSDAVWSVAVSADGSRVVTGSRDRTARVWDADSGQALRTTLHTPAKPGYPAGFASWRPGVPMIDVIEGGAWRVLWIRDNNGRVSRPVIPGVSYEPPAS